MKGVLKFSDGVREACPKAGFDEVEKEYERAREQLVPTLKRSDLSRIPMHFSHPFKARVLFQAALRRCMDLSEATCAELNAERLIPSFLLSRGCLETACVVDDMRLRIFALLDAPTDEKLETLGRDLLKATFGARADRWKAVLSDGTESGKDELSALNVVTIVERVARKRDEPFILELYEDLSEHAHPNCAGMVGAFADLSQETHEQMFPDPWQDPERRGLLVGPVNAVGLSLFLIVSGMNALENRIIEFVRVTEESLHRSGTWPDHIPYRWKTG